MSQQDEKQQQQHHQQAQAANAPLPLLPSFKDGNNTDHHEKERRRVSRRHRALDEAQDVLDSLNSMDGTMPSLDGFNLLGVVANPRAGSSSGAHHYHHHHHERSASRGNSSHGGSSTSAVAAGVAEGATNASSSSSFYFTDSTMQALESTLYNVTEQIDVLNDTLDYWSKHYLGSYDDGNDNISLLEYVPPELEEHATTATAAAHGEGMTGAAADIVNVTSESQLQKLQQHLEDSGRMAQTFRQRRQTEQERRQELVLESQQEQHDSDDGAILVMDNDDADMTMIAPLFYQDYFDLTDPATFLQLLVRDDDEADDDGEDVDATTSDHAHVMDISQDDSHDNGTSSSSTPCGAAAAAALSVPTETILRLRPPDHFTTSLDRVEVALLNQVRKKSTQFFQETNRFGLLQEWIAGLVLESKRVRTIVESLTHNSVHAWEAIPLLDETRRHLTLVAKVLDGAQDVVRCKASIGGLLSAGQDLSAAEQIQYGRQLLLQQSDDHLGGGIAGAAAAAHGASTLQVSISSLQALSTVEQQLSQYEALVVANLSNELIEVFLDFNSANNNNKPRVVEMVRGLELCNALSSTGALYGSRLNDVIRMTVRTTVGEFAEENAATAASITNAASTTVKTGVTSMALERFLDCLDMLFEQVTNLLKASVGVKEFCEQEDIAMTDDDVNLAVQAVSSASELSVKSISELLRLRKDAHSLVSLEEMKRLWDVCMSFTAHFENLTDYKATALRSTLLAQAKAFVEHKHESNMSSLVAALESERWTQCDVSAERQEALTRLCLGRSIMYSSTRRIVPDSESSAIGSSTTTKKMADAEVEGIRYKVVWSCLLLVEMVMADMACASHFKALATNMVGKVAELLRLFNSRATQLVLGAGAIHSAARLKSINAKHLSLVTQCVGLVISILPHVRAALMAQLPAKQHTLLNDLDTIKREYEEHNEKILNKFVNIIAGIVEHGLAPRIGNTDFDLRAKEELPDGPIACCVFLEGISTNTRKMHQVLSSLLPPDHLQDSFSRIFAYLDQKLPELLVAAAVGNPPGKPPTFSLPSTDEGKTRMLLEVKTTTQNLNALAGVRPWDFTAVGVLEQELDYRLVNRDKSQGNGTVDDKSTDQAPPSQPPKKDVERDSMSVEDSSSTMVVSGNEDDDKKPTADDFEQIQSPKSGSIEEVSSTPADTLQPLSKGSQKEGASQIANGAGENGNGHSDHRMPAGSNGCADDGTAPCAKTEDEAAPNDAIADKPLDCMNGDYKG